MINDVVLVSQGEVELHSIGEPVGTSKLLDINTEDVVSVISQTVLDGEAKVALDVALHFNACIGTISAFMVPSYGSIGDLSVGHIALNLNSKTST